MINMEKLLNKFWTSEEDMENELEELGYEVLGIDYEYVYVMDIDDRMSEFPTEMRLKLLRANRTIAIVEN